MRAVVPVVDGGRVVALGRHVDHPAELGDTDPRQALVLVEWPDRAAFDAFLADLEASSSDPAGQS